MFCCHGPRRVLAEVDDGRARCAAPQQRRCRATGAGHQPPLLIACPGAAWFQCPLSAGATGHRRLLDSEVPVRRCCCGEVELAITLPRRASSLPLPELSAAVAGSALVAVAAYAPAGARPGTPRLHLALVSTRRSCPARRHPLIIEEGTGARLGVQHTGRRWPAIDKMMVVVGSWAGVYCAHHAGW